jgi:acetyltransferase
MPSPAAATSHAAPPAREWTERLRDGSVIRIRPIAPADLRREHAFLARLSPEYRAYRFLGLIKPPDESVARELTAVDPACETALVALADTADGEIEIGVARCCTGADGTHGDCAVTVDPAWQRRGVGWRLMQRLIELARARGVQRMYAADAARCAEVHHLAERLGFRRRPDPEDPLVDTFELTLE